MFVTPLTINYYHVNVSDAELLVVLFVHLLETMYKKKSQTAS